MTRSEILERIQNIFRDVFDDSTITIKDTTSTKDIEGWDSLAQINIIVLMEKEFKIKYTLQELEDLKNVGDMINLTFKYFNK